MDYVLLSLLPPGLYRRHCPKRDLLAYFLYASAKPVSERKNWIRGVGRQQQETDRLQVGHVAEQRLQHGSLSFALLG